MIRAFLAPVIFLFPYYAGLPIGYEVASAIAIFALIGDTNYVLHLHIHRPFSRNRALNLALDLCMGSVTGMTASNWRIQHLYGHHCGIDLLFRGSTAWELERYTPARALSFCLRSILPTFWRPLAEAFRKGVLADVKQPICYRWTFAEHCLLVAFVGALVLWDWRLTLLYALPFYAVTYFISRYVDYLNHYGCDEHSENAYDRANNCLTYWFNRKTSNFGYHTAHHLRPGAHWTELPRIHSEIAGHIPTRCLKRFSWSVLLLPYHFWRARWNGM